jgi:vitamin K-dependent gamma-carboxylase-like protein
VPNRRPAGGDPFGAGWFDSVPAYRLASLRVVLAVITLVFHVPKFNGIIEAYTTSSFHLPPTFSWMPSLTRASGVVLMALQYVAVWSLLLGWAPRLCAWFLAAVGFYVMSLDPEYYAHNAHFHLTLLALIGCATDRVSLRRLVVDDGVEARCHAWPERLIRIQLAIVFFYAAVDKVLSPHWGLAGSVLAAQRLVAHGPGLALLQRVNGAVLHGNAGVLSAATIAVEFFLATAFLVRPLWSMGVAVACAFVLYLEFILRPGVFAFDVLAALLVFTPAGDRAWKVVYGPGCLACRWNRAFLSPLDWLRRLQWISVRDAASRESGYTLGGGRGPIGFRLVSPGGRAFDGIYALRRLPAVLPGSVLVAVTFARFGGGVLASRGYGPWDDIAFVILGIWLALWLPGVARYVGRPMYGAALEGWGHWSSGRQKIGGPNSSCGLHVRGSGVLDPSIPPG